MKTKISLISIMLTLVTLGSVSTVVKAATNKELEQAIQNYHSVLATAKASRTPIKNNSKKCKQSIDNYLRYGEDLEDSSINLAMCCADYNHCSDLELYTHLLGACAGNQDYQEDCFLEYGMVQMESSTCPQCSLSLHLVLSDYDNLGDAYKEVQSNCF